MSVSCGLEWVVCLGCTRWAWKRLTYVGAYDSENWPPAEPTDFSYIPRICRVVLAVYDPELSNPKFAPEGGYGLHPDWVVKRVTYEDVGKFAPPYIIYADRENKEISLAIRGLNLTRNADYKVLLDNRLGMQMFDGGYVHHGLLKSAQFILERETRTLKDLLRELGSDYSLVFAGHSLGSGIAALMTVLAVNNRKEFGNIPRSQVRCYAIAPARCMSLNLAVKYADVINSVILQDDFLPRTPTPLEHIFEGIFCLPCVLFLACLKDTFKQSERKIRDPRRLYAPGRMYHIVERRFCRCARYPPEVRTAIPVEGRFEHIVLSGSTTSDHAISWIEREASKALQMMMEDKEMRTPPPEQMMERMQSFKEDHRIALQKAATLKIPHAVLPEEESLEGSSTTASDSQTATPTTPHSGRTSWDHLVEKLFTKSDDGKLVMNRDIIVED